QRQAVQAVRRGGQAAVVTILAVDGADASDEVRARVLAECLAGPRHPAAFVGEPWTEGAFAAVALASTQPGPVALRVQRLAPDGGVLVVETSWASGKLRARQSFPLERGRPCWISLADDAEVAPVALAAAGTIRVERWSPPLGRLAG